ncbi:ClpP/crotonase-like domain-containing protein [Circinella umbellata]|nr:ClpP/crotonase-like domain-containing protein [Circinella umbellata]
MSTSPNYQYETVKVEVFPNGVVHVQLDREKRLNAFNYSLIRDILQTFKDIDTNSNVRSVVLSGAGRMFSAGLDLKEGSSKKKISPDSDVARQAFARQDHLRWFQSSISSLEKCSKPVIVCIHNDAIDAGIDLFEVDVGLAADIGTLQCLPKVIGNASLIRELAYTSRNMYADEALQCGLINKIFDTKEQMIEEALKIASEIATKSPVAIVSTNVDEGLEYTAVWNSAMLMTKDIPKSVEAFMKKKPAAYANL